MKKTYADLCLERAEKATEGPWHDNKCGRNIRNYAHEKKLGKKFHIARYPHRTTDYPISHEEHAANAEFIANARGDVPELARRLTRAIELIDSLSEDFHPDEDDKFDSVQYIITELEKI